MKTGKGRILFVAFALVLSALAVNSATAGLFGLFGKSSKTSAPTVHQTLVVFPFDQSADVRVPEEFGQYVASDLRTMLTEDARYSVLMFRAKLSPISRAKSETALKDADIAPPYSDDRNKPLVLSQLLAADYFLVGSVDSYDIDPARKIAMMTISAEMVDAKTGKLVKTLLVTGKSPEVSNTTDEDVLRDMAKGDAVTKLIAEILASPKTANPAPAPALAATAQAAGEQPQAAEPKEEAPKPHGAQ